MKTCSKCKVSLPKTSFYKNKVNKDGYQAECKECRKKLSVEWQKRNPEKVTGRNRLYGPKQQALKRLTRYAITPEEYAYFLKLHNGLCAICNKPSNISLSIDHNHNCCPGGGSCGKCVRGLLCSPCNIMLGGAKDNTETLRTAIAYLEYYNSLRK
jgi:hypothetical protein